MADIRNDIIELQEKVFGERRGLSLDSPQSSGEVYLEEWGSGEDLTLNTWPSGCPWWRSNISIIPLIWDEQDIAACLNSYNGTYNNETGRHEEISQPLQAFFWRPFICLGCQWAACVKDLGEKRAAPVFVSEPQNWTTSKVIICIASRSWVEPWKPCCVGGLKREQRSAPACSVRLWSLSCAAILWGQLRKSFMRFMNSVLLGVVQSNIADNLHFL